MNFSENRLWETRTTGCLGILWAAALALLLVACEGTPSAQRTEGRPGADNSAAVWVMSNGWHTDIILRREDIPPDLIPEIAAYPEGRFFAFGWGDARYYPARSPSVELAIKAIGVPTPAAMHLTAIPTTPEAYYRTAEVLRLPITVRGQHALAQYIHASFARDAGQVATKTSQGLYRHSGFYPATGRFHLFNTCNTWAARGLMQAGLEVGHSRTIQAEALMRELRAIATGIAPWDSPELRPYYLPR